jgi:hypothetical protein
MCYLKLISYGGCTRGDKWMGSPYGWLLKRDWFSLPCILKEELGFKPSKVREVGLFLHKLWQ